jgi:hypothetical protein
LEAAVTSASFAMAGSTIPPEVGKAVMPAPQTTTYFLSSLTFVPIRAIRG